MPATYSSRLRALQQEYNTNPESWGGELNTGAIERLDEAWAVTEITVGAEVTLTSQNALADQSRGFVLIASGDGGFAVITPAVDKPYLVINDCIADITMKPTGGTAATIRAGSKVLYYTNEAATVGYVVDPTLDKVKTAAANVALGGFKLTGVGTATSATDAATLSNKINDFTAPTTALAMNSQKITGLADPTADQDAATRAYVISQTAASVAAAAASASAASDSEDAAAVSETNAGNSETAAINAQAYAEEWAVAAEDTPVSVAAGGDASTTYSALHWAAKAEATAATVEPLPTLVSGQFLTNNGTTTNWAAVGYASISPYSAISADPSPAVVFSRYLVDTSGGAVTVTLPASPTAGDWIEIIRDGANAVTVGRNGNNIAGSAADLTIDTDGYGAILLYTAAGWIVSARVWA